MTNDSYYQLKAPPVPPRPSLAGAVTTEIAIVGGGLAGLGTALSLAERGHGAVVLEASTVGAGASGRNGGMVSAGFAAPMRLLERAAGRDSARTLMRLSREAMDLIRAPGRALRHPVRARLRRGHRLLVRRFQGSRGRGRRVQRRLRHAARVLAQGTPAAGLPVAALLGRHVRPRGVPSRPVRLVPRLCRRRRAAGRTPVRAQPGHDRPAGRRALAGHHAQGRGQRRAPGPVPERLPAAPAAGAGPGHLAGVHLHHRDGAADRRPCRGDPGTLRRLRQPLRHRLLPPPARTGVCSGAGGSARRSGPRIWPG